MIAVLGWGSLVWCQGGLRIRTRWRLDGPGLPIEFARVSSDKRLTLVIVNGVALQTTLWAESEFETLSEARDNLKEREGAAMSDIHAAAPGGEIRGSVFPQVATAVRAWLATKPEIAGVVWTGLPPKGILPSFSAERAVAYLKALPPDSDVYQRARQYVTHAPSQIQPAVRAMMRSEGWADVRLATTLFDGVVNPQGDEN